MLVCGCAPVVCISLSFRQPERVLSLWWCYAVAVVVSNLSTHTHTNTSQLIIHRNHTISRESFIQWLWIHLERSALFLSFSLSFSPNPSLSLSLSIFLFYLFLFFSFFLLLLLNSFDLNEKTDTTFKSSINDYRSNDTFIYFIHSFNCLYDVWNLFFWNLK